MTDGPAVNERIARRRAEVRAGRRRRRLRRTLVVLALVALVGGAVAIERSALVALASVEVTGLERLQEEEVLAAAGVQPGMSVLRIRRGAVAERVRDLPLVEDAAVERVGALGLRIEVVETPPVLTARFANGVRLIAADGTVIGDGEARGVPVVDVVGPPPAPGDTVEAVPALATAHQVVLGLPGPLGALVEGARAVGADDLRLRLDDGTEVRWGGPGRSDEKARALGAVLEDLGGRSVTTIDVRAPMAPTVEP